MLPRAQAPLQVHLAQVRSLHSHDLADGWGLCSCPRRWHASTRQPPPSGDGSGSSPSEDLAGPTTHEQGRYHVDGPSCSGVREAVRKTGSPRGSGATPSGTHLPPTCSRPAMTSVPSRSSSDTRVSPRHDLHACAQQGRPRSHESSGSPLSLVSVTRTRVSTVFGLGPSVHVIVLHGQFLSVLSRLAGPHNHC